MREPGCGRKAFGQWDEALDRLEDVDVEFVLSRFEPLARLGYRAFRAGSYIALYYRENDDAVIAHVFHQSRDYAILVGNGM